MRHKLQVLLVDDEGLLRDGLCAMLNLEDGFAVAGVVSGSRGRWARNRVTPTYVAGGGGPLLPR